MYYILFYKTIDNYVEKRTPFREEHLRLANAARANGTLVMAGALADPADEAVLVFRADSPQVAEDFAKNDPYVKNGLIKEWKVRSWTVVVGEDQKTNTNKA
ncbi:MAG TPA: YciI-like protein [Cyclobacteriaceae bacterium]|nr:YciI family protein [Cyclobacteriaceae bacterium]HMV07338.1 YciI-like protein [Cyclobacteriaceae bacterium]HMV88816.1 YciI-like protein [Cyclobacteriaceae bacterium]HMW99307.1 YciI-like protein [Cyclobacteriaceae bacterium]HMX48904.1 YciI-like protein [Cyclobacteriaceae bacterium]